ncbi:TIGR03086 family metal-binding protein [Kineosporia succinea]|uniref:Uncharacterized protein (TIGR03086 family) n=1 Tax=Kineosporia succinea TaxID=84632 RepID=A0ABT9NXJ8_9ACTN|nr:TIGR03086 family metal-binding protein [Kineosporia succinea]MDP9824879.1 uncharacterized protein (TIGR03086 family) [Kineosporia succinea]
MIDFTPATTEAARLLPGVRDLEGPTPCGKWPVEQVLDHLLGLSYAFTLGAAKQSLPVGGPPPEPTGALPEGWRDELPRRLGTLAAAWADPSAWQGVTTVGGVAMPGEVCALVALDEVVVHSWDLAVATGQELTVHPDVAGALLTFWSAQEGADGDLPLRSAIFGEVVEVPAGAPVFERVLGLTGRDPRWAVRG